MPVTAIAINCTLKKSGDEASSTDAMIDVLKKAFADADVEITETLRMADYDILPGVTSDEGEGDAWPQLREKILSHDILIFGGPIWMGAGRLDRQAGARADGCLSRGDRR